MHRISASADAIVLSAGANNVFQDPENRARAIRDRDAYAQEILERVANVVTEIRAINPDAELILLGGYNPLPDHPLAGGISRYIKNWDKLLNKRFPLLICPRMSHRNALRTSRCFYMSVG